LVSLEVGARLRGAMSRYSIFGNIRGYSSLPEDNAYIERYNIDEILSNQTTQIAGLENMIENNRTSQKYLTYTRR